MEVRALGSRGLKALSGQLKFAQARWPYQDGQYKESEDVTEIANSRKPSRRSKASYGVLNTLG